MRTLTEKEMKNFNLEDYLSRFTFEDCAHCGKEMLLHDKDHGYSDNKEYPFCSESCVIGEQRNS